MKRKQLIDEIEQLDKQLGLRLDIVELSGALVRHQLRQVNPALLVGGGALAGAATQRLGLGRTWGMGVTGVRLLPVAQSLLPLLRSLGLAL
ncbi:MAG TPA: hypothetical protein DEP32_16515 [Pseudomonas sp.]|nr:hypothetical protein [Pseudomonadales bacterium]MAQ51258.1 hypothetical protein [Pseudomonas sp.]MEE3158361.1 hypothetical protein [Pseudomonadota bacterium]MBB49578.1 hypothetical protein [Pseudomonadales bacterium]MBF77861.1 hypothetical protein [Pseudomonadales bacterium]|tara:strand:+ start:3412 stop:3684 length:273 start_codon:yes stop_codon:yes gene_type:complete